MIVAYKKIIDVLDSKLVKIADRPDTIALLEVLASIK
jgi:hypothetical protein